MDVDTAKKLIQAGEIFKVGFYYCRAIDIEYDALNRPWLKVRKWLIHPSKNNICNAEGIGYIPLF